MEPAESGWFCREGGCIFKVILLVRAADDFAEGLIRNGCFAIWRIPDQGAQKRSSRRTGLKVQVGSLWGVLDRRDKDAISLLRVRLRWSVKLRPTDTRQAPGR